MFVPVALVVLGGMSIHSLHSPVITARAHGPSEPTLQSGRGKPDVVVAPNGPEVRADPHVGRSRIALVRPSLHRSRWSMNGSCHGVTTCWLRQSRRGTQRSSPRASPPPALGSSIDVGPRARIRRMSRKSFALVPVGTGGAPPIVPKCRAGSPRQAVLCQQSRCHTRVHTVVLYRFPLPTSRIKVAMIATVSSSPTAMTMVVTNS